MLEPMFKEGELPNKQHHFCEYQIYKRWAKIRYNDDHRGEYGYETFKKCKYCGDEK